MHIWQDKRTGHVYEVTSYRQKDENGKCVGNPRHHRKCIGKMVDGEFVPNSFSNARDASKEAEYYKEIAQTLQKQLEDAGKKEDKNVAKHADAVVVRKKAGLSYAVEAIMAKTGMTAALRDVFDEKTVKEIISIAEYMIAAECCAMDDFEYYDRESEHCLGAPISSSESSRLFSSIDEDAANRYFRSLQTHQPKAGVAKDMYYSSFDSTAFGSYSDDIDIVEASKGKQDPDLKHFSLAAIHNSRTDMCAYYRLYRGNIPDSRTVEDLARIAKEMGLPFCLRMIFDRGYVSWELIFLLHIALKWEVMVMLKANFKTWQSAVEKAGTDFRRNSANYIPSQGVYATSVSSDVALTAEGEEHDVHCHVHVYYSPERYSQECEDLEITIEDEIARLNSMIADKSLTIADAKNGTYTCKHKSCIRFRSTSNRSGVFEKDADAINAKLATAGCFCILTTEYMTASEALLIYRGRDAVERLFNCVKNDLGFTRAEVKNDNTLHGKTFCVMAAANVVTYIRNMMRDHRKQLTRKMTFNKLRHELEAVYAVTVKGKRSLCEISERQELIFKSLEIPLPAERRVVKTKRTYVKKNKK